jgi:methionyl-tRNA synthetase
MKLTTTNNTNTPTEYFKCNICNRKFAIPTKPPKTAVDDSSFGVRYEREYVNLLSDMRAHIDKHRQERPNHKIPQIMLLNLFTRVQDQGH